MNTAICFIIPAFGHAGMTADCVSAALASTGVDIEVLVVDDASPDPLALPSTLSPARVLRNPTNLGFAGTCNVGASAATAEWLLFVNNDVTLTPSCAQTMLACASGAADAAIVGARLLYRDGTIQHAGVAFSVGDGAPRHLYRGFPGDHPAVAHTRDLQAVTGACLLVRRCVFEALGGFEAGFVNGFEDIDLCLRARAAGHRVRYCGQAVAAHLESVSRPGDPNEDTDPNQMRFAERWAHHVERDEVRIYADDTLIRITPDDVYPLRIEIDPLLGHAFDEAGLAELLAIRSRQVFDLEKEVGYLAARLQDHGIEP